MTARIASFHARHALLLMMTLACLSLTAIVSAQEITITGGSLEANGSMGSGPLTLEGDRGFTFLGETLTGAYFPGFCNGGPCAAGQPVSLYAFWGGSDVLGVATLDGITYPRVGDNADTSSTSAALSVEFSGSFVLPPGRSAITLVAPFLFRAMFYRQGGPDLLVGSGLATIELTPILGFPNELWGVKRVVYRLGSPLPPPWLARDVGSSSPAGRASIVDGSMIVAGDGADIWGVADSFQFAYQPMPGSGSVTARVLTRDKPANPSFAKAGVMIRQGLPPSAAHVILDVKPDGGLEFMVRYVGGEATSFLAGAQTTGDYVWLRLARASTQVTASYSTDGVAWTMLGTVSMPFVTTELLAGLAVTSHQPGVLYAALFDNVSVTGQQLTDNLLAEGDFEGYTPPMLGQPGWISDDLLRQVPAKSETHQPRSGAKNGACWTPEYLDCGIYQEVIARVSGLYAFSIYATSDRAGGLVGVNVNGATANSASVEPLGFGNYSRYALAFTASAGDIIRVWMYSPAIPGYVVIDDASLTVPGVDGGSATVPTPVGPE